MVFRRIQDHPNVQYFDNKVQFKRERKKKKQDKDMQMLHSLSNYNIGHEESEESKETPLGPYHKNNASSQL